MKKFETIIKALADEKRARILKLLSRGRFCVCELASILRITQPAVSRHLKKLKAAGLIDGEQKGFWTDYFMTRPAGIHERKLVDCILAWLDGNTVIEDDRRRSGAADRQKLCCK